MNKTIWKLDSKQKLRFLTIYTEGSEVVQISGLLDTDSPVENRSQCVGKNIGKANETTPEEQAEAEAQAKLVKKLREGYYETPEEAQSGTLVLPMLAKDYKKEFKKVKYPAFVQAKLDGMRALKNNSSFISRTGLPIETLPHLDSIKLESDFTLDGELYAHGISFQENMKLIKKNRPESVNVKYHVYDLISDLPFMKRIDLLADIVKGIPDIEIVPTYYVNSESEMLEYHKQFLTEGYEGTIIRWGSEGYDINKRSSNLLKYKDFLDIAVQIVDVMPSESVPDQGQFRFEMNGINYGCIMGFSHEERREILINKQDYIGKTAELRFFEYTDANIPRHPRCLGIRLDK